MHDAIFDGNVYFNRETSYFIRNITAFKVARQRAWFPQPGAVTERCSMKISTSDFEKCERWKFIVLAKSFKTTCDEIDFQWYQMPTDRTFTKKELLHNNPSKCFASFLGTAI